MNQIKSLAGLDNPDVFVIDIKMRKNGTWQGTLRRKNEVETTSFRSALELLKLMDTALGDDWSPPGAESA